MKVILTAKKISSDTYELYNDDSILITVITTPYELKEYKEKDKVEDAIRLKSKGFDDDSILEILKDRK